MRIGFIRALLIFVAVACGSSGTVGGQSATTGGATTGTGACTETDVGTLGGPGGGMADASFSCSCGLSVRCAEGTFDISCNDSGCTCVLPDGGARFAAPGICECSKSVCDGS